MATDIEKTINYNTEELFTLVGSNTEKIDSLSSSPYSYWRETFKHLFKKPSVYICLGLLLIIIFLTIFGPMFQNFSVSVIDGDRFCLADGTICSNTDVIQIPNTQWDNIGPNATNWFGVATSRMDTVWHGLDMWTLVWQGSRLSLLLGIVVALIDTILGIIIGALWGYFRWLDPIMIEIRNFISNIPGLLLDILFMQIFIPFMDQFAFIIIVFLLTMFGWMGLASFVRNQIIIIRNREYNIASQTLGSKAVPMITHNFLPYIISVIVSVVAQSIPAAISAEVGLSYFNLSFKITDGDVTLGQVLTQAARTTATEATGGVADWMQHPWIIIAPLLVLAPITICFYYLGIAIADASDPKRHR